MTMFSEKENILKGLVVSTADYDTGKKIIGISSANLTPNEEGIAPLSKENAFVKEIKEQELPNTEITESLTFLSTDDSEPKEEIQETNPLSDINPQGLNEISVDVLKGLDGISEEKEEETTVPIVDANLELPEMEEIVAQEPDKVNEDLFASLPNLENLTQETMPKEEILTSIGEVTDGPIIEEATQEDSLATEGLLTDLPLLSSEEESKEEISEEEQILASEDQKAEPIEEKEEQVKQSLNEAELLVKILEQLEKNNELIQTISNEIGEIKKQIGIKQIDKSTNIVSSMVIPSMESSESTLTL